MWMVDGCNFPCVMCMYTNCLKQFQTQLAPAWNSTFFGFPRPATLAKMISPEDWAPTAWSNYHTPKTIKWEILLMNFHCLAYLSKKNTLHVEHQGLCQPCHYIKVWYTSDKKKVILRPILVKSCKNHNFLRIVLSSFLVHNIVSPISDRRKRRPSSEAATSLAQEIKPLSHQTNV